MYVCFHSINEISKEIYEKSKLNLKDEIDKNSALMICLKNDFMLGFQQLCEQKVILLFFNKDKQFYFGKRELV